MITGAASGEFASREERGRKPEKYKKRLQSAFIHKSWTNRDIVYAFILEHTFRRYKKQEYRGMKDHDEHFSNTNFRISSSKRPRCNKRPPPNKRPPSRPK